MGFVPKRAHSPSDVDPIDTDHARKKYISEQFANAMAALSLDHDTKHSGSFSSSPPKEEDAVSLIKTNINGHALPLEQRPGDEKLRIPEFILQRPPLTPVDHVRALARYPTVKWRLATPVEEYKVIQGQEDDGEEDIWEEPSPMDID